MQDQEPEKPQRTGLKDKIWGSIALLILVAGGSSFWYTIHKLPRAEWRNEYTPLAWESAGVRISEAEAYWKASAGDARMELRSYNYPVCRIKLDKAEGNGHVTIRFINGQGVQMGDRVYISYKDGKFGTRESNSMNVTETEAQVRLEDGFLTKDEYTLHQFDEYAPLWKVEIDCRPENGEPQRLGHLSILPHDL